VKRRTPPRFCGGRPRRGSGLRGIREGRPLTTADRWWFTRHREKRNPTGGFAGATSKVIGSDEGAGAEGGSALGEYERVLPLNLEIPKSVPRGRVPKTGRPERLSRTRSELGSFTLSRPTGEHDLLGNQMFENGQ
jgi:hypothetical protein